MTSLSFALAGIFGLSVYCASMSEVGLTEADLNTIFPNLPERCIVLLEDIDSAGLRREGEAAITPDANADTESDTDSDTDSEDETQSKPKILSGLDPGPSSAKKAKLSANPPAAGKDKSKIKSLISLAGLLNIIDGAASQEIRFSVISISEDLFLICCRDVF
jgi:chaperone BCS1